MQFKAWLHIDYGQPCLRSVDDHVYSFNESVFAAAVLLTCVYIPQFVQKTRNPSTQIVLLTLRMISTYMVPTILMAWSGSF